MNVLKYIKYRSTDYKIKEFVSLDIFYLDYRISINGLDNINLIYDYGRAISPFFIFENAESNRMNKF